MAKGGDVGSYWTDREAQALAVRAGAAFPPANPLCKGTIAQSSSTKIVKNVVVPHGLERYRLFFPGEEG